MCPTFSCVSCSLEREQNKWSSYLIGKPKTSSGSTNNWMRGLENHLITSSSIFLSIVRRLNVLAGDLPSPCYYSILFVCSDTMIPKVGTLSIGFFQHSSKNYFSTRILQNLLFKKCFLLFILNCFIRLMIQLSESIQKGL